MMNNIIFLLMLNLIFCHFAQAQDQDPLVTACKQNIDRAKDIILVAVYKKVWIFKSENKALLHSFARVVQIHKGKQFAVGDLINYKEGVEGVNLGKNKIKEETADAKLQYLFVEGVFKKGQKDPVDAYDLWYESSKADILRSLLRVE